ncbi:hypothetical protein NOS3756_38540 [Nostoc sp. NIES-3756]|uniref:hypothetical protein n=1 Tax=Nostoc sp. NIES-3756 TaxID=1751286 RepID=UPI0007220E3D|nr:hypothetical protein [Nostoc sp. NIES-3756]BAT54879.1 hypothetical protein NOS3756_38540 [Nostoc sp. NIES-3756]
MRTHFNNQPQTSATSLVSKFARGTLNLTLAASLVSIPHVTRADGIPSQIQGEWSYGRISSIQYQDSYTGTSAQPNGSSDRFKVTPNGNYERARLLQINTYGCASYLFIQEKGKVKIDGQKFIFEPRDSFVKGQQCSASNTYERRNTAKVETYSWFVERNDYGQDVLVLETLDGKGKAHYGRPK